MIEVEHFILRSDRKFLQYIPDDTIPINVYRFDKITNQWITMTPSIGLNITDINQYAYLEDLSCIVFHKGLLNQEIKVEYQHNGIKNPFLIHETLDLVERLREIGKYKISDSIYLDYSKKDKYTLTLNGGSILYNGELYIIPKHDINFRSLGLPTVIGQYYGYLLYIGTDTINHNLYKPLKQVKPTIIRTNFVYKEEQFSQAKAELLQQANKNLLNPEQDKILELAYVYITIVKDSIDNYTVSYIVDYPLKYRKV